METDTPKYNEEALARAAAMWCALLSIEVSVDQVIDCLDVWEVADRSCRTSNLRIRPDFDHLYENEVAIDIPPLTGDQNIMTQTEHLNVLYPKEEEGA